MKRKVSSELCYNLSESKTNWEINFVKRVMFFVLLLDNSCKRLFECGSMGRTIITSIPRKRKSYKITLHEMD